MTMCETISVNDFLKMQSKEKVRLIDIRTQAEYNRENISGAECILVEDLEKHKFNQEDEVVFHCQSGNRTKLVEHKLQQLNLSKVYMLDGGLNAWKKAGQKTQVNTKAPLPIMRQVQIVVGFMVVLGVILALTVSPYFSLISAFFGGGLLFAGLSGYCGLANMLMFLPYNKPNK